MIYLKTEEEIELLRKANLLVSATLAEIAKHVKPGVSTLELDTLAEQFIRDHGAIPTFKGFPASFPGTPPFPASLCTSVNECVVHGVPTSEPLREGDIVSIDCGTYLEGFCGDSAYTFCVGEVSEEKRKLLRATKDSLYKAIDMAIPGRRIGDIGYTVQSHCEAQGYGIVREFVGHGVGREMHEEPAVPNYGRAGTGKQLKNGMCIAIEPMITLGSPEIGLLSDGWSIITRDRSAAAHFEHSIAIHNGKADILSSFEEIERIEGLLY
ncbi:MAG: type I methionyl aminopeptidase [Bacteroidales bacterium]|nr:type I methionyl aminopeptidase [Bacteroidales bacterium]